MTTAPAPRFSIAVLLATYNGARYLDEQLESLWRQTRQDFELVVRDDGSTDGTLDLLRRACAQRPGRIRLLNDDAGRLGPKRSFAHLLERTDARWIAFCDQDDVWVADKLERQVQALQAAEGVGATPRPVLCCSDAAVTDAQLCETDPSYFAKHDLRAVDGRDRALPRMLFRNFAIGATTMINAPLAALCRPIPRDAVMHDWWCALVAAVAGTHVVLADPLLRYRQHGANAVGSQRRGIPRSFAQMREYLERARRNDGMCVAQAHALLEATRRMRIPVPASTLQLLEAYAALPGQSPLGRVLTLVRTRGYKPGVALNGLHLYACATAPMSRAS